jgi:hypothetical protein
MPSISTLLLVACWPFTLMSTSPRPSAMLFVNGMLVPGWSPSNCW